ncbi:MAG: response regulator [Hyphomicrobiaceae bacterium]
MMKTTAVANSRKSERIRVFKGGTIATSRIEVTLPCVVRDVSQAGALIQSTNAFLIPDTFRLIVDIDGLNAECQVIWRRGTKVGVQFLENESPASLAKIKQASLGGEQNHDPFRLLIAEDDPDDRFFFEEALAESSVPYEVHFSENGEDLLHHLFASGPQEGRLQPDLIILDLNMPKIDGRKALSEIKANGATRAIPVVVLTTSNNEDDILKIYNLGASSYIAKPPGLDEYKGIVNELLNFWNRPAVRRPAIPVA